MKKRLLAMLMTGAMVASLAACGGGSSTPAGGDTQKDGGNKASTTSGCSVDVILKTTASEYWSYVKAGAEAYSKDNPDVKVEVKGATSETAYDEQQNMIETDLNSGAYDAFVIAPLQADLVKTLIAGQTAPIVAVDTNIDAPEVLSFVGTGNEDAAAEGGKAAVEAAKAAGWDKVQAIAISGVQGDGTATARLTGYEKGVTEAGGSSTLTLLLIRLLPRWKQSCRTIRKASLSSSATTTIWLWLLLVLQRATLLTRRPSSLASTAFSPLATLSSLVRRPCPLLRKHTTWATRQLRLL